MDASRQHRVVDLRLAPPAAAVWAVTLLGLFRGWVPLVVVAILAGCAVPLVWSAARRRKWGNGVLAVLVLASASSAGLAARTYQLDEHRLRATAEKGGEATLRVVLGDRPIQLEGSSYGGRRAGARSIVPAELRAVRVRGRWVSTGGDILMLVPSRRWTDLIAGQRVTTHGTLIPPRRGDLLVAVVSVYEAPRDVTRAPGWQRAAEQLRDGLRTTAAAVLGPDAAGLLPGLVVGDTSELPETVVREFDMAGLSHLTAVSGANLAIVCGAVLLLLRLLSAGPVVSAAVAGLALVGFVVLAGPEPSVLRAAVMGAITLLALVLGRQRSALPALSASVIGLLLWSPELATSPGFALSVTATAALVLLAPGWAAALHSRGLPVGAAEAVAVPAAAQVATAPLVAALSGQVSVVGVLANLLAGPVVAPATVLGVAATLVAPVSTWAAEVLVWFAAPELEWVLLVAHYAATVPGATFEWPSGATGGLLLAGLTVTALIALRNRRVRWSLAVLVFAAGAVLVPVRFVRAPWPVPGWSLVVCDVGQGDSLVLATGRPGTAVVVDTGSQPAVTDACLQRLGIRRIPLVVLTHLHADHVGGLPGVLDDRTVGAVAVGPLHEPRWAMRDVRSQVRAAGVPLVELSAGQHLRWPGLVLDVLGPAPGLVRTVPEQQTNDASLVITATTTAGRVLLTGDIELRAQTRLLASGRELRAEILKVPHHGSRYTSPSFLRAVHPRLALISVGHGNDYGHPSPTVVAMLRRMGATVLRTDRRGDIAVLDGPDGLRTVSRGDPLRPGT